MSNETRYYFGAYLEVEVKEQTRIQTFRECGNGHKPKNESDRTKIAQFCSVCGLPVESMKREVQFYPAGIEEIIGEQWEESLSHLNSLSQPLSVLRLIDNRRGAVDWLELERYHEPDSKEFPTAAEIEAMKAEFSHKSQDVIAAIAESPDVVSVTMKAGCVMDTEY